MTRTPLSRSKGQRSRSPGRFTHRRVGASGSCSGGRGNVLAVRNCCYIAVCSAAQGAEPTGRGEGRGHIVAAARLQLVNSAAATDVCEQKLQSCPRRCLVIYGLGNNLQFLYLLNDHFCDFFCCKQRIRTVSSSNFVPTTNVAVLSPYVAESYTGHVDRSRCTKSTRCGDEIQLQPNDVMLASSQLTASSTSSVYDNVTTDESTVTSKTLTLSSPNHVVVRRDDLLPCRRCQSFTIGDSRQTSKTTCNRRHRDNDHCDDRSIVRYSC